MIVPAIVAAAQAVPAATLPDIQLQARVEARSVTVRSSGTNSVRAYAEPDGGSSATSSGRRSDRRFTLDVEARIADPTQDKADAPPR